MIRLRRLASAALVYLLSGQISVGAWANTGELAEMFSQYGSPEAFFLDAMERFNDGARAGGLPYRAVKVEYLTDGVSMGNEVIAKDVGNKQLDGDFVPYDARRLWSSAAATDLTYAIDTAAFFAPFGQPQSAPPGVDPAAAEAAIENAMATWDAERCSDLGLSRNPDFGVNVGVLWAFFDPEGPFGSPFIFADIQHAGWEIPLALIDPEDGPSILAFAFTFAFVDPEVPIIAPGNPGAFPLTDIDNNGKFDVAFREIHYNPWVGFPIIEPPGVPWSTDESAPIDVETIALHETGHALSQAHFGKVFIDRKGYLKRSPAAVMNAVYTGGARRELTGADRGGHCSNWARWPNR